MRKIIATIAIGTVLIAGVVLGSLTFAGADQNTDLKEKMSKQDKTFEDKTNEIDTLAGSTPRYLTNDNDNNDNDNNDNDNNDNDNNDNDNNDDECTEGDDEIDTRTHTITSADPANSVVIDPVCAKMFVMIFKTDSDHDGKAEFQAQREDGTWATVGPGQGPDETQVGGMDSFGAEDLRLPLTVRVVIEVQATTGTSFTQIDFLGGEDDDDDNDDDNDNDDD